MRADTYKKRIVLVIIASVFFALVCGACLFLLGCSSTDDESNQPIAVFTVRYHATDGGYIDGETEQQVEYDQNANVVRAIPNDGYEFDKWSDGITEAVRIDLNVKADITVNAIFRKKQNTVKQYTVTYTTDGNGKILGASEQIVERGNNASEVTAIPNEGYEFVKWSDGVTEATRTDNNIFAELTVNAEFKKKIYYKLKYFVNSSGGGTIVGDVVQNVAQGESGSTVTAVPDEGYEFAYWGTNDEDEQWLTAERTDNNITQDTAIVAFFRRKSFTVEYKASKGGGISYIKNNTTTIYYGEQSSVVRAVPSEYSGYVFLGWSDGLKTAERTEYNVKSDMVLTAYFGYSAEYKVNNGVGGRIIGETYQGVLPNEDFVSVEAVPDKGYAFGGWSDLQTESVRQDTNAERCIEHIAYFEPIVKTFNYDYGIASGIPMENTVTVNRENIILDGYPTPEVSGYTFEGWYADSEYKLKVINGDGRYMLGYYGFSLETDTLYARWKPIDDDGRVFKILLVFVNEVKAKIYPNHIYNDGLLRDVHSIMTTIDREYCILLHDCAVYYLCDWLSDLTDVEIDAYFTINPISEANITVTSDFYALYYKSISEINPLFTSYNSVLCVFKMNNYDGALANRNIRGSAGTKFGEIYLDHMYLELIINHIRLQDYLMYAKESRMVEGWLIGTCIHEFIHTCQRMYSDSEIVRLHDAIDYHGKKTLTIYRLYLLGQLDYYGQACGIPRNFWANKCDEMLSITH